MKDLRAAGVEAVAVSLLFSFLNPAHEEAVRALIEREWPEVYLSVSSETLPVIREYERTSTIVLNAYVGPILTRYLEGTYIFDIICSWTYIIQRMEQETNVRKCG